MAQVKKNRIREAILAAALQLYSEQGFQRTTLAQIARKADVSSANLYVYFGSKLEILYAVYEPWMRERIAKLERKLARIPDAENRLRALLRALWREIPEEQNGFVNNLIQAVATATPGTYNPELLEWVEGRIRSMLREALPGSCGAALERARLEHALVMALDGYAIHKRINPRGAVDDATIELVARMLLAACDARAALLGP